MTTIKPRDIWWQSHDGLRLHAYDHGDVDASKTLVIEHGYGEHGGRYHERAQLFVDAGYRVLVPDVRGHGQSEGVRGYVPEFSHYIEDMDQLAEQIQTPRSATGLLGHSNGGLIVLRRSLLIPTFFAASAVTSPLLGLSIEAPKWKLIGARILSRLAPTFNLPTEIDPNVLSHDPDVVRDYEHDPLGHKVNNPRWFTEAMRTIEQVFCDAGSVTLPIFIMQGGDDRLVSAEATRQWAGAAPSEYVSYTEIPGAFHELMFEVDGEAYTKTILAYFEKHLEAN